MRRLRKYLSLLFCVACGLLAGCATSPEDEVYPPLTEADELLLKSLKYPDSETFEKALANGANPNARDPDTGRGALAYAVLTDRPGFVRALLKAGADKNLRERRGNAPIHFAASLKDTSMLELLIQEKVHLNPSGAYGWTPLMEAARLGNTEAVRMLVEAGADPNVCDNQGRSSLMWAASSRKNALENVRFLIRNGARQGQMDSSARTPVIWAVDAGNTEVALYMIDQVVPDGSSNDNELIGILLLKHAIHAGDLKVVDKLIELGIPINSDVSTVYKTSKKLNIDGVHKIFARHGLSNDGKKPLMWAAEKNNLDMVRLLLEHGANPHALDNTGNTAYNYASDYAVTRELKKAMGKK